MFKFVSNVSLLSTAIVKCLSKAVNGLKKTYGFKNKMMFNDVGLIKLLIIASYCEITFRSSGFVH